MVLDDNDDDDDDDDGVQIDNDNDLVSCPTHTIFFTSNSDNNWMLYRSKSSLFSKYFFQVINMILCDLSPLWLGSLSVTPSKKDILR